MKLKISTATMNWLAALCFAALFSGVLGSQATFRVEEASPAERSNQIITLELSARIDGLVKGHNVGFQMGAVLVDGVAKTLFEHGGWGNSSESGGKVSPQTLFHIGSTSKAFLAASVGILMDDFANGRNVTALPPGLATIDWDTKIADLFPDDWELMDEWASKKTSIRDALAHVSGLPRHDMAYSADDTPLALIRRLRYLEPTHELREKWSYNNIMYMLGSQIVTAYSGMPYISFVTSRILEPLGMNSSTLLPDVAAGRGLSQAWTEHGRRIPFWWGNDSAELIAGAGGIFSNAVDMTKWLEVLLHEGQDPKTHQAVIPRGAFKAMTTAQVIFSGEGDDKFSVSGYGLAWLRLSYRGHELIYHTGGLPGFTTFVCFLPSLGLGLVNFVNADGWIGRQQEIIFRAIDSFLGIEEDAVYRQDVVQQMRHIPTLFEPSNTSVGGEIDDSVDLEPFSGRYTNAGYGSIDLCAPTTASAYCTQVRAAFARVDGVPAHALLAAWPRFWTSHLRMEPRNATHFGCMPTRLFADGYGADAEPFEVESGAFAADAEFVRDAGGGVRGFSLVESGPLGSSAWFEHERAVDV